MILESLSVGPMQVNCYILAARAPGRAIIIDPGADERRIKKALKVHRLEAEFIVNTHGHFDHIACDDAFGVPVYIHRDDLALLKDPEKNLSAFFMPGFFSLKSEIRLLEDKQRIGLEGLELEVIHLPGHTPGGIGLLLRKPGEKVIFTGDSLFCQGVGRTDFPGASHQALVKSIRERLFCLSDDTLVYPGHGPASSIGREKKDNPFLN